jgi:putative transposase
MGRYGASQRQACAVMKITRSVYGYCSRARDGRPLLSRIKEIAATRVHYGYRRVHVLLRREGWKDNHTSGCKAAARSWLVSDHRPKIANRWSAACPRQVKQTLAKV